MVNAAPPVGWWNVRAATRGFPKRAIIYRLVGGLLAASRPEDTQVQVPSVIGGPCENMVISKVARQSTTSLRDKEAVPVCQRIHAVILPVRLHRRQEHLQTGPVE